MFEKFNQLHTLTAPLILSNVWDAAGAILLQNCGAKAIATSSASVAWSLGYCDGGMLPEDVHLAAIRRIVSVSQVPVTVDIENGYSDNPNKVAEFVARLLEIGVTGINIEDGSDDPGLLAEKITAIKSLTQPQGVFINARTDVYLRGLTNADNALIQTIERLTRYKKAGANCGFVPATNSLDVIDAITSSVDLPLNVMINEAGETLKQMKQTSVARISVGPATFLAAYSKLIMFSRSLFSDRTSEHKNLTYAELNNLFIKSSPLH